MGDAAFEEKFGPFLAGSPRFSIFSQIVEILRSLNRPVHIVETGCSRQRGNWMGDGQSTIIWDWVIGEMGGSARAFDISPEAVEIASSLVGHVKVIESDSIKALTELNDADSIDLFYLDSMDWEHWNKNSANHHLKEFASIWDRMRPGALVGVDDNFGDGTGKGEFIRDALKSVGIEPIADNYITVWQKPDNAPSWQEMQERSKENG